MVSAPPADGYKRCWNNWSPTQSQPAKLLKMLHRLRRRAGKVRDLDVQLTALRSLKVPQEPRRKTQLMQGLIELRVEHEKKLRKMLTKDMFREIAQADQASVERVSA